MDSSAVKILRFLVWAVPLWIFIWTLGRDTLRKSHGVDIPGRSAFSISAIFAMALTVFAAFGAQWLISIEDGAMKVWLAAIAGGLSALFAAAFIAHLTRRLNPEAGLDEEYTSGDRAVAAIASAVLLGAYMITRHSARTEDWIVAACLGASFYCSLFTLSARSGFSGSDFFARICPALEASAVGAGVISLGILIGRLNVTQTKHAGDALVFFIVSGLLVWAILSIVQHFMARRSALFAVLMAVIYLFAVSWTAYLITPLVFAPHKLASSFSTGLFSGVIISLIASSAPSRSAWVQGQVSLISFLLTIAAAAVALRAEAGFGAAACAAGLLAAIPAWAMLAPWRTGKSMAVPSYLTLGASSLICLTSLRLWMEWMDTTKINIYQPYAFLGFALSIALPRFWLMFVDSGDDRKGSLYGLAFSIVSIAITLCILAGVAIVLREPAVRLFLLGMAGAGLMLMASNLPARRFGTVPGASLPVAISSVILISADRMSQITQELGRPEKVKGLIAVFVVIAVCFIVAQAVGLVSSRGKQAAEA